VTSRRGIERKEGTSAMDPCSNAQAPYLRGSSAITTCLSSSPYGCSHSHAICSGRLSSPRESDASFISSEQADLPNLLAS
jgi:hypothetical protein